MPSGTTGAVKAGVDVTQVTMAMDAMIGRLTYDEEFAKALANNPREALEASGVLLDKDAVEVYMETEPERFDKVCEALFGLVDSDFLHNLIEPSCD